LRVSDPVVALTLLQNCTRMCYFYTRKLALYPNSTLFSSTANMKIEVRVHTRGDNPGQAYGKEKDDHLFISQVLLLPLLLVK